MPDLSGQSVGRYHIIAPLGEGGMATVYKAFDTRLECDVAIKFIRKESILPNQWERMIVRFEREAKRMAKFLHPNIVKVMDFGEYQGSPYLVMPLLPGGTLKELLKARKKAPIPYTEAARILAPVARALEYAHEQETIHRDVKPANILLTDKGQPMLTDFGVAKILDLDMGQTLTGTGVGLGTPKYMAPEQWMNQISPQTDIYALGVVFYEMVTGRVPYDADTPAAVMLKQNTEPLPRSNQFAPDLPEWVENVIYKALARKPEDRYAHMGAFAEILEKMTQESVTMETVTMAPSGGEKGVYSDTFTIQEEAVSSIPSIPSPESESVSEPLSIPQNLPEQTAPSVITRSTGSQLPQLQVETTQPPVISVVPVVKSNKSVLRTVIWVLGGLLVIIVSLTLIANLLAKILTPPGKVIFVTQVPVQSAATTVKQIFPTLPPATLPQAAPILTVPAGNTSLTSKPIPVVCKDDANQKKCAVFKVGETIKIGFGGPMSGDFSAYGVDISNAGIIAVKDAGELEGHKFVLVIQDDYGSIEGGAAAANKMVSDPQVVAIAGHILSGATITAIPVYNKARLPMLSPSATRGDLTRGDQDVFNRIAFTDDMQGEYAARYLFNNLSVRQLAVMHDGDPYGKGVAQKVRDVFKSLGGKIVAESIIISGEKEYNAMLASISTMEPDAIFYGGYYTEAALIANQKANAGMEKVVLFSDDGTYSSDFLKLAGKNAEGVYAATLSPVDSDAKARFDLTYKSAYGQVAGELSAYTWSGYDVVSVLIEAIKKAAVKAEDGNLYIPREALIKAVRATKNYNGLSGKITCQSNGECNASGPTFVVVKNGKWEKAAPLP
ncbi:MAG: bifunctional serine/threonine-protein kinase/ABC transporter substrate-binding protein [Chloroflexota bacterium]